MQNASLSVGDPIEARCTKCRKNNEHVILIIEEEAPIKVQCGICSRQHKFRLPIAEKKPAVRRVVSHRDAERKEWEGLRATNDEHKATDYCMTSAYKVKAQINHPSFGLGFVQRVAGAQKVEVLFETGKKMMRCK